MQVADRATVDFTATMWASGPSKPLVLDSNVLDPAYDYDYSNMSDDGTEYMRGDRHYYRPYGWKRFALKVRGKYEDDTWLGAGIDNGLDYGFIIH